MVTLMRLSVTWRPRRPGPGDEEGAYCNRDECDGRMGWPTVEGCSCHISPPRGACENSPLTCDQCGYEVDE